MQMARYVLGIDLGGTKILAAVFDEDGSLKGRARSKTEAQQGEDAVFERIVGTGKEAIENSGIDAGEIAALGIGSPGPLDPDTGYIIESANLNFKNFPLGPKLAESFGCKSIVGNDVSIGTYGEFKAGAARGAKVVLGMFVGTGIGGGIVIDGELYHGFTKNAGEVGHMVIKAGGPRCHCGSRGCLEALASRTGIARELRDAVKAGDKTMLTKRFGKNLDGINSGALKEAYKQGDKLVRKTIRRASRYIGIGIGSLVNVLGPEIVVLGGGVIEALGDEMIGPIEKSMRKTAFAFTLEGMRLVKAQLGDDAGVVGAATLAREKLVASQAQTS